MSFKTPVNILWTGGWDSTFQLLQLLIIKKQEVKPYYIIDNKRKSTEIELQTMEAITQHIFKHYSYTKTLLKPLSVYNIDSIPKNQKTNSAFKKIREKQFIGKQYNWLSRFCDQKRLTNLQLCIHRDDKAFAVIKDFITPDKEQPNLYRLDKKHSNTIQYEVFNYFDFPILDFSKVEMHSITKKQNLQPIMKLTWFCHKPTKKLEACGTCNPCLYTLEEGLGYRIPFSNRLKGYIKLFKKRLKNKTSKL